LNASFKPLIKKGDSHVLFSRALSRRRDEFKLGPPNLLAAVVSGLSVVGLLASPKGWWGAMLLPYAALGLTLVLLCLLAAFGLLFGPPRSRNFDKNRSPRRSEHPPSEAAKRRREHPRGD
jgi:hypothetical protein